MTSITTHLPTELSLILISRKYQRSALTNINCFVQVAIPTLVKSNKGRKTELKSGDTLFTTSLSTAGGAWWVRPDSIKLLSWSFPWLQLATSCPHSITAWVPLDTRHSLGKVYVVGIYCNARNCPVSTVHLPFMLPATPDLHPGHYTGDNGENIARVIQRSKLLVDI